MGRWWVDIKDNSVTLLDWMLFLNLHLILIKEW